MKKALIIMVAMVFGLSLVATTGFAAKYSGFLGGADQYAKMKSGPKGGVDKRWLNPETDFSKYKKVMVDGVILFLAENAKNKGIDPQAMKKGADAFNQEMTNALKDYIVDKPGPDVARIRIAITNLTPAKVEGSRDRALDPYATAFTNPGEMTVECQILDSASNQVIALAMDSKRAWGASANISKAQEYFKFWAGRIKIFWDEANKAK